jgi:DNA-binding MurR/RpiR family transcriptional regulator
MSPQPPIMSPRLLAKIEASLHTFSPNDRRIADYLLVAYPRTTWGTVEEVAQAVGVSKSAVVRLASRLGYDGFQELQRELQADFAQLLASPASLIEQRALASGASIVDQALQRAQESLQLTRDRLAATEQLATVAERLVSCRGRVLVVGLRKTFGLAAYLQYLLSFTREDVFLARPDTASFPEGLIDVGPDDVLLALSVRRYTRATLMAMEHASSAGAYVVAITDTVAGPAAARADAVLVGASEGVLLYDSAVSIVFIIEALANSMVRLRQDDSLERLKRAESIGRRFSLFEDPTLPLVHEPAADETADASDDRAPRSPRAPSRRPARAASRRSGPGK